MTLAKKRNHGSSSLGDREEKLTVMESLRMSDGLLRMIADECKSRNLGFSDYMRHAAKAAMKQNSSPRLMQRHVSSWWELT
jgi:hypothetical protein